MNRRWLINRTNQKFLEYLSRKASISTTFAQILLNRGIKDPGSIKAFLSPSLENLHNPFLMPDMKIAVERIKIAIERNESVLIHGDYDADGITATALLVSALRGLGLNTYYHIPNRVTEGYGISQKGVQKARDAGVSLIITVDCGISSEKEVLEANSLGMDVIITDHHEPPQNLPPALAVVTPPRKDSTYPFKYLAGVGVAYKLVQALTQEFGAISYESSNITLNSKLLTLNSYLDLVAIGTIADSVPLVGENRILVAYGLKELNNDRCRAGVQALKEVAGVSSRELKSETLSYTIIPRINAAGRVSNAGEVVELFLTEDSAKAKETASFLEEQNKKRQIIEEEVYKSAIGMIDDKNIDKAIVLSSSLWHPGVIGIVASRLVEEFYRPTFLFSVKGTTAKGSARSIPPFHIYKGIAECDSLLLGFGGHSQAAGLSILLENLPAFRHQINLIVRRDLSDDDFTPTLEIDAGVELFEVNFNLVRELTLLGPFGNSNEEPLLGAKGVEVIDARVVGNGHLKMRLKQGNLSIDTIGFDMGENSSLFTVDSSRLVDAVFVPSINEWNGNKVLQLKLKAIRPSV